MGDFVLAGSGSLKPGVDPFIVFLESPCVFENVNDVLAVAFVWG